MSAKMTRKTRPEKEISSCFGLNGNEKICRREILAPSINECISKNLLKQANKNQDFFTVV